MAIRDKDFVFRAALKIQIRYIGLVGFLHGEKVGKLQSYLESKSEDKSIFKPIILGKDLNGF